MAVVSNAGSTVPRRQLGRQLRQLREEARITVKAAAGALEWSTPKLWRIEGGMVSMRALDVEAMCRVYGAAPEVTAALMSLAKQTRARGWWHAYTDVLPSWFELYVGLEAAARRLRCYEPELVPSLLQTPAYATELLRITRPGPPRNPVDRHVAALLARQAVLTRAAPRPPRLEVLLNEAALRRPLVDRIAMSEQLTHVVRLTEEADVSVYVLPLDLGPHPAAAAGGSFTLLEFPIEEEQPVEPATVYTDNATGALYLDKPAEVATYDSLWAAALHRSLDEASSRELIVKIAGEYRG